ncbi:lysosomal proton-coupled steroid conjugate and bile acid symporter SLC46A3-like isoform X1 [Macrobrachium nipponense]|uniref:lysosomal proton-coupled steroid conjugate and bile acid symporter SLC46A3-like isoform X1 n=1 Tax=Macrobrachium nipponense TaxID=159736 RepID=UPI0030C8BC16
MECTRLHMALRSAKDILGMITIEPMLFLKGVSLEASLAPIENLKLDRYCRVRLGYPGEVCEKMNDGHHETVQAEVQKLVNIFNFYDKLISSIIPVLMISFIASWSDQRGRRVPILASIFGTTLYSCTYLLVSLFPSWPPEVLYVASFCSSLGGGWPLFYMAAYSYIVDKSEAQARTKRLAILRAFWLLGTPTGTATGTLIYDAGGYLWVTGFSTALYIMCFVYSVIFIKDNNKPREANEDLPKQRSLFSPKNVSDLFRSCLRERRGNGRLHIFLLVAMMLFFICMLPHNLYLWGLRVLNWDIDSYTVYKVANDMSAALMMLSLTPVFVHLRLHDCSVGAMTATLVFSRLLALAMTTSPSEWWIPFLFVFIPTDLIGIAIRSQISKICEKDEIGRVFAMLAVLEVFWPIVDSAIFTSVYGATIEFYPSFEHLVGAGFAFLGIAGFLGLRLSLNNDQIRALKKKKKMMIIDAEKAAVVKSHPVLVRT